MRAVLRSTRVLRRADRVVERDRLLRGKTQMRVGIRISSGRFRRRSMAGGRLRITSPTVDRIRQAIGRRILAVAPAMAIPVLFVRVMGIRGLNRHQGEPVQQQERQLRNDPNFNRLPPAQQQRLVQQLHQLNQMPQPQRDRRLARSEMLERMSPQEQNQVRQAGRSYMALPPERQAVVKRAFQDLRSVPPDQRATVINSQRYQNNFSPDERDILTNLLRAEPYEAPR
jgi:hypothetical protein